MEEKSEKASQGKTSQERAVPEKNVEDRRNFLKMAAGGAAAIVAGAQGMAAQNAPVQTAMATAPAAVDVSDPYEGMITEHPGSDFMVDVFKSIGFDYIASNPGASFRALQESLINYGKNRAPEWLTCCHEESSVAMSHGYFKIEGKPMMIMAHGTVGLQHAAMAVYNAYADRVPVFIVLGNTFDAVQRRPGAEWAHSVQDAAAMVRDYTKWDDMPISLGHFAESVVRAYKIAMTPPMEPVVIVADSELQERPFDPNARPRIPRLTIPTPPAGEPAVVEEVARMLVEAENPVILGGHVGRTQNGIDLLVELAEALQCGVIGGRFPSRHRLSGGDVRNADLILALEHPRVWGALNSMTDQLERTSRSHLRPGAKVVTITATDLFTRSNYQDFQRFQEVDLAIAADATVTLPSLVEAVKRFANGNRRNFFEDRGRKVAAANEAARERQRQAAVYEWDLSPVSLTRINYELWEIIKDKDWSLVNSGRGRNHWNFTKHYQQIGGSGGGGVGYGAPASVGAALANKKHGRLSISIQNDGDLMYAPGVLWTAAHHQIPLLTVMNNNRAYHQEVMHLQRMSCRHNRDLTTAEVGNVLTGPNIDYAKVAQGMGWYAEGPITDPKEVGPALRRAIAVVERGEPALLDTVVQPR